MLKKPTLFLLDLVVLYSSLGLVIFIRYREAFSEQFDFHVLPFSIIFSVLILIFFITNLYDTKILRNNLNFYSGLSRAIATWAIVAAAFFYFIPFFTIAPKTNLFLFVGVFSGISFFVRSIFNRVSEDSFKNPALIVGVSAQALELAKFITQNPQLGYELRHIINLNGANGNFDGFNVITGISGLNDVIKREQINTIIVSPEIYQSNEAINAFYEALENKVSFRSLSSFYEQLTNKVPLGAINQIWFLENLSEGSKRGYESIKRVGDIIMSVVFGLITIILWPFIMLAVKLNSPGPILYRQERVGQNGKTFQIIKFRTMRADAEKGTGATWAQENDPRVTKIGRFLRKTRLDELPQVWNIFRGDMSFVGPRAERPEFHDRLKAGVPFYEERYLIKPGLTGWAQINYSYGSSVKDAAEKLQYDLYYIKNRSAILDIGIILKTINIAMRQAGR